MSEYRTRGLFWRLSTAFCKERDYGCHTSDHEGQQRGVCVIDGFVPGPPTYISAGAELTAIYGSRPRTCRV